jgi:hypothetical protein
VVRVGAEERWTRVCVCVCVCPGGGALLVVIIIMGCDVDQVQRFAVVLLPPLELELLLRLCSLVSAQTSYLVWCNSAHNVLWRRAGGERERERVCVCVCECESEREESG